MEYIIGAVIWLITVCVFFALGRLIKIDKTREGYQEGFDKGYRLGRLDAHADSVDGNRMPNPLQIRQTQANRKHPARPDSAGSITSHRAKIRGDYRLPQNQIDTPRANSVPKQPPQTKLNLHPADTPLGHPGNSAFDDEFDETKGKWRKS